MNKTVVFLLSGIVVLGSGLAAAPSPEGRGFHVGLQAGFSPTVWFYDAYSGGVEIGWLVSSRFGVRADLSAGTAAFKTGTTSDIYASVAETRYTSLPVCLSFLYLLPASDALTAYIGAGAGFYSLTIHDSLTEEGYYLSPKQTETSQEIRGFAPHLSLGLEGRLSGRWSLFGEVRQSLGRKTMEISDGGVRREQAVQYGGLQLKAGVRLYFR